MRQTIRSTGSLADGASCGAACSSGSASSVKYRCESSAATDGGFGDDRGSELE